MERGHTYLSYLATDAAGNTGSISRIVTYIKNPDAEIHPNGEAQLTIEAAVAWTDPGVTITHEDGTPAEGATANIETTINASNPAIGQYTIIYKYTDRRVTWLNPSPARSVTTQLLLN